MGIIIRIISVFVHGLEENSRRYVGCGISGGRGQLFRGSSQWWADTNNHQRVHEAATNLTKSHFYVPPKNIGFYDSELIFSLPLLYWSVNWSPLSLHSIISLSLSCFCSQECFSVLKSWAVIIPCEIIVHVSLLQSVDLSLTVFLLCAAENKARTEAAHDNPWSMAEPSPQYNFIYPWHFQSSIFP